MQGWAGACEFLFLKSADPAPPLLAALRPWLQETAAAATGHAKQFEMLAKTSEEALKSMQGDHEKFKMEAAAR